MANLIPTEEMKSETLADLKRLQIEWARENRIEMERPDYTAKAEGNLFTRLSKECIADLGRGLGSELERRSETTPAKFHALHSSSALVANVFDYWRNRGLSILTQALNSPNELIKMEVESQFPTGYGFPANLDVVFWSAGDGWALALESKFCEPFGKSKAGLKIGYLPKGKDSAWKKIGLDKCDLLAREIETNPGHFEYLDVPQLEKHILALHKKMRGQFRLMYLFYDVAGPAGEAHRQEAEGFKKAVEGEIDFEWQTYQRLVSGLKDLSNGAHSEYFEYLSERYRLG